MPFMIYEVEKNTQKLVLLFEMQMISETYQRHGTNISKDNKKVKCSFEVIILKYTIL